MYSKMRSEILVELQGLDKEIVNKVMLAIDKVSVEYDVTKKSTELIVYNEWETPKVVQAYIVSKFSERASRKTLDNYLLVLTKFFDYVRVQPEEVTPEHIRLFLIKYQEDRGISDNSLNNYRVIIGSFFAWLYENDYILKDPSKRVKKIKCVTPEQNAVSRIDLEKLRYHCKGDCERAMVEFLVSTGCRGSEFCNVKVSDVDFENGVIPIVGKGKKRRTVFLNTQAIFYVKQYVDNRGCESEYLFCSERSPHGQIMESSLIKRVKKLTKRAGVKNYTPHSFRRATATILHENGMSIRDIQIYLGHEKMDTTGLYVKGSLQTLKAKHSMYLR